MKKTQTEEINLLDYVAVLVERRRMIVRNTLVAAVLMALVSLVLPRTFTASTTILPPDDGDQGGLRSLLANSPVAFMDLPGNSATSSEIFVEILNSRTVALGVLEHKYEYGDKQQSLLQIWQETSKADALRELRKQSSISSNEQGIISISVEASNPELAAAVAQTYVGELDRVNQEKSFSKAKNSRVYIEEQLEVTEKSLRDASQELATFQEKSKAVNLEEQTKVAIGKAGEIKGTIMAKEVELAVAKQTMKHSNPIILRIAKELSELKKQFEHLQYGNSVPFEEQRDYFIPFSEVPDVSLKFAALIREVKVQETVWQLLNEQYYSVKIQEARDTPTVQVLDEAVPPEKRTRPRRTLLVLVATSLTFCFSIFGAFVFESVERLKEREADYERITSFRREVIQDVDNIKAFVYRYLTKEKKP